MYALVLIILLAPEVGKPAEIKYRVTLTPSSEICEVTRVQQLQSLPPEFKIANIRHGCISLGREQKES